MTSNGHGPLLVLSSSFFVAPPGAVIIIMIVKTKAANVVYHSLCEKSIVIQSIDYPDCQDPRLSRQLVHSIM